MPWGALLRAILLTAVFAAPLALSLVALLDAARRPMWAWALAERSQVTWMAMILLGTLMSCAGVAVSTWYLWKVRPVIASAEQGMLPPHRGGSRSNQ